MKRKYTLLIACLVVVSLFGVTLAHPFLPISLVQAASNSIDIDDLDYDVETDNDVEITVDFNFNFTSDYDTLMFYLFLVEESDDELSDKLGAKRHTYGLYLNATNGTSGLVSKSYSFTLDSSETTGLSYGEDIRIYVRAYNGTTVTSSKLIKSAYKSDDWPYGKAAETIFQKYITTDNIVIFLIGCIATLALLWTLDRRKKGKSIIP